MNAPIKTIIVMTALALFGGISVLAAELAGTNAMTGTQQNSFNSMNRSMDDMTGKFGIGVILGEPIGASAKYFFNDTLAIDGAAGWSDHDNTDLYVHSDVLWHKYDLIPVPSGRLPVYIGVGALVRFRNHNEDNEVGVRVPIGLSYIFENAPVDIFAEIGPAIDVSPDVKGEITGGVGVRVWF
jgi:hypothetical protein